MVLVLGSCHMLNTVVTLDRFTRNAVGVLRFRSF
jgi:hypothetical protein